MSILRKIKSLLNFLVQFWVTGVIGAVDILLWNALKNNSLYLEIMNTKSDPLGLKYAVILLFVFIPMISAIKEYNDKKRQIELILRDF